MLLPHSPGALDSPSSHDSLSIFCSGVPWDYSPFSYSLWVEPRPNWTRRVEQAKPSSERSGVKN